MASAMRMLGYLPLQHGKFSNDLHVPKLWVKSEAKVTNCTNGCKAEVQDGRPGSEVWVDLSHWYHAIFVNPYAGVSDFMVRMLKSRWQEWGKDLNLCWALKRNSRPRACFATFQSFPQAKNYGCHFGRRESQELASGTCCTRPNPCVLVSFENLVAPLGNRRLSRPHHHRMQRHRLVRPRYLLT